ncbi:HD domain-containing protein [Lentibacillus sediminis]|uniref:HD domain-containing protein n=1 Tax=Lentibacillus sediminis TaxID=1940529 RepID=UPI000C1B9AD7|nr:HD domain-containing protein [Lentibacillus sediminis]
MHISDPIYGAFKVEPVLEELIGSKPVQRLRGIHQGGASYLVNEKWNVTRFDHSIGVILLIRKLGGTVEEQIAGLLHDVSHTAFSHVADYVFDNQKEDYHEEIYRSVVADSEIPWVLDNHGYDYQTILYDEARWTLLERPAPELCADRIDYTLRDMYVYGHISLEDAHQFLLDLIVVDGKICLQHVTVAEWFANTYYKEVIGLFMDPLNIYGNEMLARTLKHALEKQVLDRSDFLGEDEEVISKLKSSQDSETHRFLKRLHPDVRLEEDQNGYDFHRKSKVRLIDPLVINGQKVVSASSLSNEVKRIKHETYERAMAGVYVKHE